MPFSRGVLAVRRPPGSSHPTAGSRTSDPRRSRGARRALRVLLVEGSAAEAALTTLALGGAELRVRIERVTTADAFGRALLEFLPDVILADQDLVALDPVAALRLLRAQGSVVPLIVVANALDAAKVVAALKAGAEDVVVKRDRGALGAAIAAAVAVRQPLAGLSPRQREVLRLMADGRGTRAIAALLRISVKTVETHRAELTRRLGITGVAALTRYAVRVGLVGFEWVDATAS